MSDRPFDPNTWFDAYKETFASVHKAQEEGFKAVERLARFQYAVGHRGSQRSLELVTAGLGFDVCDPIGWDLQHATRPLQRLSLTVADRAVTPGPLEKRPIGCFRDKRNVFPIERQSREVCMQVEVLPLLR